MLGESPGDPHILLDAARQMLAKSMKQLRGGLTHADWEARSAVEAML